MQDIVNSVLCLVTSKHDEIITFLNCYDKLSGYLHYRHNRLCTENVNTCFEHYVDMSSQLVLLDVRRMTLAYCEVAVGNNHRYTITIHCHICLHCVPSTNALTGQRTQLVNQHLLHKITQCQTDMPLSLMLPKAI